jgi:hypothetical protein
VATPAVPMQPCAIAKDDTPSGAASERFELEQLPFQIFDGLSKPQVLIF